MQRGGDDVIRRFLGELNDVFAEIGFHHLDAVRFQTMIQVNLFGDHRFGFDDQLHPPIAGQAADEIAGVFGIARPDHRLAASSDDVALQLFQVMIQMIEREAS